MGPRSQNGCLTHVANDKSDTVLVSSCTDTWLVAACSYPVIILNMCPPPNMYPCKECGTWRKNGGLEYTLITIIFVIIGGWVVWLIWQGGATQQPLLPPPSLSFTFVHRVLYLAHAHCALHKALFNTLHYTHISGVALEFCDYPFGNIQSFAHLVHFHVQMLQTKYERQQLLLLARCKSF